MREKKMGEGGKEKKLDEKKEDVQGKKDGRENDQNERKVGRKNSRTRKE